MPLLSPSLSSLPTSTFSTVRESHIPLTHFHAAPGLLHVSVPSPSTSHHHLASGSSSTGQRASVQGVRSGQARSWAPIGNMGSFFDWIRGFWRRGATKASSLPVLLCLGLLFLPASGLDCGFWWLCPFWWHCGGVCLRPVSFDCLTLCISTFLCISPAAPPLFGFQPLLVSLLVWKACAGVQSSLLNTLSW